MDKHFFKILVVDDEIPVLKAIKIFLEKKFSILCSVSTANNGKEAIRLVKKCNFDIVLLDLKLPDINGLKVLDKIKSIKNDISVIMMTGYGSIETAVQAMQNGADNYLLKPFKTYQEIALAIKKSLDFRILRKENQFLREQIGLEYNINNIIGKSPRMVEIFKIIKK